MVPLQCAHGLGNHVDWYSTAFKGDGYHGLTPSPGGLPGSTQGGGGGSNSILWGVSCALCTIHPFCQPPSPTLGVMWHASDDQG